MCQCRRHLATVIPSGSIIAQETCFPRFKVLNFILYCILTLQFLLFYFALCIVLDVAALQFVGRSISVFLTFNILLCTVYLCWTWLHCSCWSLNIGAFSNYLTINQFYLFLCLQHSHLHTLSLPNLPTILVETWESFHQGFHTKPVMPQKLLEKLLFFFSKIKKKRIISDHNQCLTI